MRADSIRVSFFSFISILDCEVRKSVNEHAKAMIRGIISEEHESQYLRIALEDIPVQITVADESGSSMVFFSGLMKDVSITNENGFCIMELELISETYRMSHLPHVRVFQNAGASYEQLLGTIGSGYSGYSFLSTVDSGSGIKDLIVQYQETDWQFAVRLASQLNTVIVPDCHHEGVKYYLGIPERGAGIEINPISYSVRKAVGEYINKSECSVSGIGEWDAVYYLVKDREVYDIGQMVLFKGQSLYVYEVSSTIEGGELWHEYHLKTKAGFQMPVIYNEKIIGASLSAKIAGVKQDQVKVSVQCESDPDSGAKWYSFSTVYSSPDGTGWYCMPEEGDRVRLYFPNEKEGEGYVISATHLESGDSSARANPDDKSIKTKYGKEVKFTPSSIEITNNNGMSIELLDEEGIKIYSNKSIKILSDEEITVASLNADMQLTATDNLKIVQGETVVSLEEDVVVSGAQTNIQS